MFFDCFKKTKKQRAIALCFLSLVFQGNSLFLQGGQNGVGDGSQLGARQGALRGREGEANGEAAFALGLVNVSHRNVGQKLGGNVIAQTGKLVKVDGRGIYREGEVYLHIGEARGNLVLHGSGRQRGEACHVDG